MALKVLPAVVVQHTQRLTVVVIVGDKGYLRNAIVDVHHHWITAVSGHSIEYQQSVTPYM
jgi:hypothetical protein